MNRTFQAFAALAAFLALAMIAVSSNSRSTTVRVGRPEAAKTARQGIEGRGGIFVIVLPAAETPASAPASAPARSDEARRRTPAPAPSLKPAQVELAAAVRSPAGEGEVDCRSYYDPQYDHIVYGAASPHWAAANDCQDARFLPLLDVETWLPLFHDVLASRAADSAANRTVNAELRNDLSSWWRPVQHFAAWSDVRLWSRGAYHWLAREWERRVGSAWRLTSAPRAADQPALDAHEYDELMDALLASQPAGPQAPPAAGTVQSGHGLLHFTASSLNHLGTYLQTVAERLEQAANPEPQISTATTDRTTTGL